MILWYSVNHLGKHNGCLSALAGNNIEVIVVVAFL